MKNLNIVALLLSVAVSMNAVAGSLSAEKAQALKKQIVAEEKMLAELQIAVHNAHSNQKTFAVKLGWDAGKALVYGVAATELYRQTALGTNPLVRLANKIRQIDPNGGTIQGPLPRFLEREAAYYGVHAFNVATISAATLAAVVKSYDATTDGIVLFIETGKVAALEAAIQVDQEKLSRELAALLLLEESTK